MVASSDKPGRNLTINYRALAKHFQEWEKTKLLERVRAVGWEAECWEVILKDAVTSKDTEVVDQLVEAGLSLYAEINPWRGMSSLHWAARQGRPEMIIHLIAHHGMDPDYRVFGLADKGGPSSTPLVEAVAESKTRNVKALLDAGAKVTPEVLGKGVEVARRMSPGPPLAQAHRILVLCCKHQPPDADVMRGLFHSAVSIDTLTALFDAGVIPVETWDAVPTSGGRSAVEEIAGHPKQKEARELLSRIVAARMESALPEAPSCRPRTRM